MSWGGTEEEESQEGDENSCPELTLPPRVWVDVSFYGHGSTPGSGPKNCRQSVEHQVRAWKEWKP